MPSNIWEDLTFREMIFDHTEHLPRLLARGPLTVYNGFDPTADSLHVGHLLPMLALARFQRCGHAPIALAGGATALIGDPSGRKTERPLLTKEEVAANLEKIRPQLALFLDFESGRNRARIVNNYDWIEPVSFIDFLRDIGKRFTVSTMQGKHTVRSRLEEGLSFTEFSYMLLQAYDFLHLHKTFGCTLQTGGSDQWGNITAGIDLIRKESEGRSKGKAHALVYPLVTRADGTKFSKSNDGGPDGADTTIWLSAARTSPFRFYQFWFNTADADVVRFLKFFTFLSRSRITELAEAAVSRPGERLAQRALAAEVTRLVHGESGLARAQKATAALFGGDLDTLSADEIAEIFSDVPFSPIAKTAADAGIPITDLLAAAGIVRGKAEARRQIAAGGINLNNVRVTDPACRVCTADAVEDRFLVLRKGKKNYHLIRIMSDRNEKNG